MIYTVDATAGYDVARLKRLCSLARAKPEQELAICTPERVTLRWTAGRWLAWFRTMVHRKITGELPCWRKLDSDWQRATLQTAQAVNTPRLIVRWVPVEFRERLVHRLSVLG